MERALQSPAGGSRGGRALVVGLVAAAVVSAVLRFMDLERDPAVICWSADAWLDPGYYLYNVRSFLLFDQWRPGGGHSLFVAPGYVWLTTGWFRIWGLGYAQAVLLSVIFGFVVIGSMALYARTLSPTTRLIPWMLSPAVAALVSLLLSYVMFARQRVPKGDMEFMAVCAMTALVFVLLPSARQERRDRRFIALAVLGGFGLGLAPFVKLIAAIFSAAVLVAWISSYVLLDRDWAVTWRRATPFVGAGLALSGIVWLAWLLWLAGLDALHPMLRSVLKYTGASVSFLPTSTYDESGSKAFAPARFLESNLFCRHPVETLLTSVAFFRCASSRHWNWPRLLTCVWLIAGVAALACMHFAPLRYRLPFLLPMIVLGAQLWSGLAADTLPRLTVRRSLIVYPASALVAGYALTYGVLDHFAPDLLAERGLPVQVTIGGTAVCALLLWYCFERLPRKVLAGSLACLFLVSSAVQWQWGESRVSHELRDTALEIAEKYPGHTLTFGMLGSHVPIFTMQDAYPAWEEYPKGNVTLFVGDSIDLKSIPARSTVVEHMDLPNFRRTLVVARLWW